uniref:NADH-ubiquinone oxidoreductase chain 2 n=1 Tax=Bembidion varium TaxID=1166835 RepID=A0A343C263_9CARA|nr:NADH dehydrogenase subunit 2 [Bembidion varium]
MFLMTLMMGTMISVSSYTWMGTWMGLEINLLSFIPIIKMHNNQYSSESSMKYFLVQALASTVFLFSILLLSFSQSMISETQNFNVMLLMMTNSALMLKMGAAPFHFWFPEIVEGMNWMNTLLLMTWQKIAPMMLLSYTIKFSNYILIIIMMSALVGSLGGLNQVSLRKLMAYSSINHLGWMMSTFLISNMMWMLYFIIYSYISISIVIMLNFFKIFYLKQIYLLLNKNLLTKFILMLNLLSLGGLPPFLGFLPKWMVIQSLSYNYMYLSLFLIMFTLITLFFYIRMTYSSLILSHNELNFNYNSNNFKMNIWIMLTSFFSINGLILCTILFNFY